MSLTVHITAADPGRFIIYAHSDELMQTVYSPPVSLELRLGETIETLSVARKLELAYQYIPELRDGLSQPRPRAMGSVTFYTGSLCQDTLVHDQANTPKRLMRRLVRILKRQEEEHVCLPQLGDVLRSIKAAIKSGLLEHPDAGELFDVIFQSKDPVIIAFRRSSRKLLRWYFATLLKREAMLGMCTPELRELITIVREDIRNSPVMSAEEVEAIERYFREWEQHIANGDDVSADRQLQKIANADASADDTSGGSEGSPSSGSDEASGKGGNLGIASAGVEGDVLTEEEVLAESQSVAAAKGKSSSMGLASASVDDGDGVFEGDSEPRLSIASVDQGTGDTAYEVSDELMNVVDAPHETGVFKASLLASAALVVSCNSDVSIDSHSIVVLTGNDHLPFEERTVLLVTGLEVFTEGDAELLADDDGDFLEDTTPDQDIGLAKPSVLPHMIPQGFVLSPGEVTGEPRQSVWDVFNQMSGVIRRSPHRGGHFANLPGLKSLGLMSLPMGIVEMGQHNVMLISLAAALAGSASAMGQRGFLHQMSQLSLLAWIGRSGPRPHFVTAMMRHGDPGHGSLHKGREGNTHPDSDSEDSPEDPYGEYAEDERDADTKVAVGP